MTEFITEETGKWLFSPDVQRLLELLELDGHEARVVGGAVRNSLMGLPVSDLDICTTRLPEDVVALMDTHSIKTVPTGIAHGTVTIVLNSCGYEVTTLRQDIDTDGRHAVVKFGRDWKQDAQRRDLTINAVYCDRNGKIHDELGGGVQDIASRTIRFIGEADRRIKEDYLRILRFFRFFAHYGSGRPDGDGLKACARLKDGIEGLSTERVWKEFRNLLGAREPSRALLWMRQTGVLGIILPESIDWGIDLVKPLIDAETQLEITGDPMQRLMTMMRPHEERANSVSSRLKFSNQDAKRLKNWANSFALTADMVEADAAKALYQGGRQAIIDATILEYARQYQQYQQEQENGEVEPMERLAALLKFAVDWKRPVFALKGSHLIACGFEPGKEVGEKLRELENKWVQNNFEHTAEIEQFLNGKAGGQVDGDES